MENERHEILGGLLEVLKTVRTIDPTFLQTLALHQPS
jgi:hypothetical protein